IAARKSGTAELPVSGLRRSGSFIVNVTTWPRCSYTRKSGIRPVPQNSAMRGVGRSADMQPTISIRIKYHSPDQDFLVISVKSAHYCRRWISFFDTNLISFFSVFVLDDINIAPYSRSIGLLIKSYTITTALGHIKVLDLTRVLAGPWATQNFADLGAEVVKIERPGVGDDTRTWGPPFLKDAEGRETRDSSSYFLCTNRGKQSVTVDLACPEGQEIIRRLARDADVLVENYKVGTLARWGLAYDDLRKINPRLVYCSITGFGQNGPYAALPGYDYVFQGMGGLMSITGVPDGQPGAAPMKSGLAISDLLTGMYATTAILAALEHRHVSGEGQYT